MKNKLDERLKRALAPSEEPEFWLNQRILSLAEEPEKKGHIKRRGFSMTAAAAVLLLCLGSVTVYAAWK